jgi:PAS domain-containing protein
VYTEDTLPHLGGAVLAAILALFVFHNSVGIANRFDGSCFKGSPTSYSNILIQKDELFVRLARFMLVAIYIHQMYMIGRDVLVHNASAERILEGLAVLTKVSFMVTVGSVATGVFKTNIDQKEQLEIMVRQRTKEIRLKNTELRRINIAFEACETAIAITDASRTVTWTNPAFEALSKKTRNTRRFRLDDSSDTFDTIGSDTSDVATVVSSVNQQLTDVIVLDENANETKLRGAFDFSSPRQDEIEIRGNSKEKHSTKTQYRVEVTPFTDLDDSFDDDIVQEAAGVLEASSKRKASFRDIRIDPSKRTKMKSLTPIHKLFLVAFHDITADHAREQAEQKAREEALLSKAMKESMVTLTVRII